MEKQVEELQEEARLLREDVEFLKGQLSSKEDKKRPKAPPTINIVANDDLSVSRVSNAGTANSGVTGTSYGGEIWR